MKSIKVNIGDEVHSALVSDMMAKKMLGNLYGTEDAFVMLILQGIKEGKEEITIETK